VKLQLILTHYAFMKYSQEREERIEQQH